MLSLLTGVPTIYHCSVTVTSAALHRLMALMSKAGFQRVQRLDDRFYQPVLVGTRA